MDAQKDTLAERLRESFHSEGKRAEKDRHGLTFFDGQEGGNGNKNQVEYDQKGLKIGKNLSWIILGIIPALVASTVLRYGFEKYNSFSVQNVAAAPQDSLVQEIKNENSPSVSSDQVKVKDQSQIHEEPQSISQIQAQPQAQIVKGEEDVRSLAVSSSENFEAAQINVGNNLILLQDNENLPLTINNIKSESFVSGDKDESKIVISWKTDKPAISELDYGKNGQKNPIAIKEDSYGTQHSVILTGLEPRTAYTYVIKCKDHFGNTKSSDYYGIYTASKPVSVFDMISKSLNEIFGWAVKKS